MWAVWVRSWCPLAWDAPKPFKLKVHRDLPGRLVGVAGWSESQLARCAQASVSPSAFDHARTESVVCPKAITFA